MFKKIILISLCLLMLSACGNKQLALNEERTYLEENLTLAQTQDKMNQALLDEMIKGGTLEEPIIKVDPYGNAPLTALIEFETKKTVPVEMVVKGRNENADLFYHFDEANIHLLPVIGLLADVPTTVELTVEDVTYSYEIMANPLPENTFLPTVTKAADFEMNNQLYFTTPSSLGHVSAYDINGDIRWVLASNNFWDVNILSDGKLCLSTDRIINSPYYATGLVIMDLLGHIETEYGLPGGYHHDVDELANGNLLVCSDDFSRNTVEDLVVEVDRLTGEIVNTFDVQDVLDMEDGKSLNWTRKDWFHNNSLDYEPTNNTLTLSGRHQDAVIVLDYDSKDLLYIIGDSQGWSEDMQKYFLTPTNPEEFEWQWAQHAASWLDSTHIMLFDNGMNRSKDKDTAIKAEDNYSRMVIYEVDQDAKTITQVFQYGKERSYPYYSPYICDNDYLGEERFLITSGGISYLDGKINNDPGSLTEFDVMNAFVSEIDHGELAFELLFNCNLYRAEKIDVSKFTFTKYEESKYLGNLGNTVHSKTNQNKLVNEYGSEVEIAQEPYLNITLERDRITVSTTVKNSDNLELLLISEDDVNVYPLHVDATPGMCVAMFNSPNGEDSLVVQTISLNGLHGDYKIAYILNDIIYDTSYSVNIK